MGGRFVSRVSEKRFLSLPSLCACVLVRCYTEDELPLMPSLMTLTHRGGKAENGLSQTGFDWFPGYFPVWLLTSKLGYGQDLSTPSCFLPVLPFDLKMGLGEKGSPFYLC